MRKLNLLAAVFCGGLLATTTLQAQSDGITVTKEQIIAEADKTGTAQLSKLPEKDPIDWVAGAMYEGFAEFAHTSGKAAYTDAIIAVGDKVNWTPVLRKKDPFHADDLCIGQAFLDTYALSHNAAQIAPLKARLDQLVAHINAAKPSDKLTWWWCDALFMAPAVLTRMSVLEGDKKYIDAMDKEWWRVTAKLYDQDEHLFYRDDRFIGKTTPAGKKVFWSRGDGWVVGGACRVLDFMPADYPTRPKYVAQLKEMLVKLAAIQRADGTWNPSLLDPASVGCSETSGTAFYCYGTAWGINHGLLEKDQYLPVVTKAWAALLAARRPDGLMGYVQAIGDRPGSVKPENTQLYATGAFLLAAGEVAKLAPLTLPPAPQLTAAAPATASASAAPTAAPATTEPAPNAKAYARYVPERMDDIAWENDRIAHRIYGPALQHNPKEHSGSGIDVWAKSVRSLVINEWYRSRRYHVDRGTGLDFYEVGLSRGDGGLGIWDHDKLYVSKDWVEHKILDLGPDQCGFTLAYAPWDANGRQITEHRTMTLKAGSNLDRIESTLDSDQPGDLIVGIGLAKRTGEGGHLVQNRERGLMSYWQPPEKNGTIGVGVRVDPAMVVGFAEDALNYLVLLKVTPGKPFVYYAGACWSKGPDFKTAAEWENYLQEFQRE